MPMNAVSVEIKLSDGCVLRGLGEHDTRKNTVTFNSQLTFKLSAKLSESPHLWVTAVAVIDGMRVTLRSVGSAWHVMSEAKPAGSATARRSRSNDTRNEGAIEGSIKWMW